MSFCFETENTFLFKCASGYVHFYASLLSNRLYFAICTVKLQHCMPKTWELGNVCGRTHVYGILQSKGSWMWCMVQHLY